MSDNDAARKAEDSRQRREAAQEIVKGAMTGGAKGAAVEGGKALLKNKKARRLGRNAVALLAAAAAIAVLVLSESLGGSPTTSGVAHVNNVSLNGSNTSGFKGAGQESGLGDDASAIAEDADSHGVPAEIVLALVDKANGPWRANGDDVKGNASTVASALADAKDATSAQAGWDMLSGTAACNGDVLVIQGQTCPDGTETEAGDGARQARLVREAWVAALMSMGEGLSAPNTTPGSSGGSQTAAAAPDELTGEPSEMVSTLATSTYGLDASTVTGDDPITVSTADPLPLATTITSRYEQIRVSRLEAAGQSWDPVNGWQAIQPEADATTEDPTAAGHVRVWTCASGTGPDCAAETASADSARLTRDQADAIYTTALAWRLGRQTSTCSTSTTAQAAPAQAASSSVTSVNSTTSGEKIEITPTRAEYVSAIIARGRQAGISDDGIVVALMVVLQESRLNMYANSGDAESLTLPHDAVGSDHDSVGLFQQRASWGSTRDRMDASTSAGLFFDRLGPWMTSHPGASPAQAAQGVQVSAFPDAYEQWEEAARQLAGGVSASSGASGSPGCKQAVTGSGWKYPIVSVGTITSDWDPQRLHPVLGYTRPHWGTDIGGLPIGTDLVAVAAGTVSYADCDGDGLCQIDYDTDDGWRIRYLHIVARSWTVSKGDKVSPDQVIAKLGNTGVGTGAHLHVETSPLDKIGDSQWCAFDPSWADRCTNPVETFAEHGVDLATGTVTQPQAGGGTGTGSAVVDFARSKVGGPYVWGGEGPTGYDCSGLVQAAFGTIGVTLPHSAAAQCRQGTAVDASQAQAGDIVCWGDPAYHVAVYNGSGGIVGAQTYSVGIVETPLYGDHYFRRLTG